MKTSPVVPFYFDSKEVRTTIICDEPWFVAKDLCNVLDVSWNGAKNLEFLDDDEKGVGNLPTPFGNQDLLIVSESGMYTLIIRSSKPEAKKFRKWVTAEVLPTIRKTGSYTVPQNDKRVFVNHAHSRTTNAPSGLDIRYTLDLSKHIINPTKTTLEILERITGIQLTDIELPFSASDDELEKLFLQFVDERCVVGEGLRISAFTLYTDFIKWLPEQSKVRIPTVKKFGDMAGKHFTKIKSSLIFYEGLHLVGEER